MLQESVDLVAEAEALHGFLETLQPADWERPTQFMTWTPWDVVAHLHFFDEVSLKALEGEEAFKLCRQDLFSRIGEGKTNQEIGRATYAGIEPSDLLQKWIAGCRDMAQQLGESNPKRRLPWFGPDMGVRMFTTARLMETWAHGQEIYDLKGASRAPTDRLKHIATIGVKTFGWTFVNRQLDPPGAPPYVRLQAPSGEIWEWNEPSESNRVEGDALDFCLAVTQTRNYADTDLQVTGEVAHQWMEIAQCFAGGAVDPPEPGARSST